MHYRNMGATGLKLSALSFGAWVTFGNQLDEDNAYACMRAAFDGGVNFFDNAEVYAAGQAETIMGAALQRAGWQRSEYVVSSKIFWGGDGPNQRGLSRKHIVEATDAALGRLGLDYVDLLFCHRPDLHTPIEETVWAMHQMVAAGKALYWGTSEWSAGQILAAYHVARREHLMPPVVEQPQYNMFHRERVEREYTSLYRDIGLGTTVWSPLAGGLLTGKYSSGVPDGTRSTLAGYEWLRSRFDSDTARHQIETVRRLQPVADDLGCTLAQLALAWCLANPDVSTVITGASRPEQVTENLHAVEIADRLDEAVMERIETILGNRPEAETDWRG